MKQLRQRYCIVGVGNTPYGKNPGLSQLAHNVMAIHEAIADAGLTTDQIDEIGDILRQSIKEVMDDLVREGVWKG